MRVYGLRRASAGGEAGTSANLSRQKVRPKAAHPIFPLSFGSRVPGPGDLCLRSLVQAPRACEIECRDGVGHVVEQILGRPLLKGFA
jgi:hypothetical protein